MREPSNIQKQAIRHLNGPAQVIAGPGSGKTFTLTGRILYLIRNHHIDPDHILVITYTRAAAAEMQERFAKSVSLGSAPPFGQRTQDQSFYSSRSVHFGTFHSICYQILKRSGCISPESLIKDNDKKKLLKVLLCNRGFSEKCSPEMILLLENEISRQKNRTEEAGAEGWDEGSGISKEDFLLLLQDYRNYLKEQKLWDFDDMITGCCELFLARAEVLEQYRRQFSYILVDEFQDINELQYRLLKLLAAPKNNLFVVGDDDQAIYGFRGATPGIMKRFGEDFPLGKVLLMTENYRSGERIVSFAGKLISANKERFLKNFLPMREGGSVQIRSYESRREEEQELLGILSACSEEALNETAIILRTNNEVLLYSQLLKNAGISQRNTARKKENIFQGFIAEDIKAFLNFLYQGRNRSDFLYFMNKPNRFLSRQALISTRVEEGDLYRYYSRNWEMLLTVRQLFDQLRIAEGLAPCMAVSLFRKTMGYDRYLKEKASNQGGYEAYRRQADQIQKALEKLKAGADLTRFMEAEAKKQDGGSEKIPGKGVSVLTMHGSKGLEFDTVFLPDVNQGVIPSEKCVTPQLMEEERRLLYVAVTRARDALNISYTGERGRRPSVFLKGLIPPPPR